MAYVDWIDNSGSTDPKFRTVGEILESVGTNLVIRTWGEIIDENDTRVIIASDKRLDSDLRLPLYRYYTAIQKALVIGRGE